MNSSRVRVTVTRAACAALVLLPAFSSAQSPAETNPGVIVSVDQKPATNPEEAVTELKEAAAQGDVLLLLNRHGVGEFVGLSVENNGIAGSSRLLVTGVTAP